MPSWGAARRVVVAAALVGILVNNWRRCMDGIDDA